MQPTNKNNKRPAAGRFVSAATVVGLMAVGASGLYGLDHRTDNDSRAHFNKVEKEAIDGAKEVVNGMIVAKSGTILHSAPVMNYDRAGALTTEAITVPANQVLRVDRPIKHIDDEGTSWYGFELVDEKAKADDIKREVFWINESLLSQESDNGDPYLTEFSYPSKSKVAGPASIALKASIASVFAHNSSEQPTVGVGTLIDANALERQISLQGLQLKD